MTASAAQAYGTGFVNSNKGWTIGANDVLSWPTTNPGKDASKPNTVHFSKSVTSPTSNKIYAEICSTYGHPDAVAFTPGTPKAYYV
jgi:hypothetical protein